MDARNPLLYRNKDLEDYVKQVGENKVNMILINKADYLNEKQRWEFVFSFELIVLLMMVLVPTGPEMFDGL